MAVGAAPCPAMRLRSGVSDAEKLLLLFPWGFGSHMWGCAGSGELGGKRPLQAEGLGGHMGLRAM